MSFVYAEKIDEVIAIYCDTKITSGQKGGVLFSPQMQALIDRYGIAKTTIICPEIAISFAGNVSKAARLFWALYEKKSFSTDEVFEIAKDISDSDFSGDTDFIIASCEDGMVRLGYVKDGSCVKDCQNAWIGSEIAHEEFQKERLENNNSTASNRTITAFLDVVQGSSDKTVGGFPIHVRMIEGKFEYAYYKTFQMEKKQTVKVGEAVMFDMRNSEGGFSIEQLPISEEEFMLRFDQMPQALLYSRCKRIPEESNNRLLFGLMLPMLLCEDTNGVWRRYK